MSRFSPESVFGHFARGESGEIPTEDDAVRRGRMPWIFRRIAPNPRGIGTLLLVAMVLVTLYFTWPDWQWTTFLSGILGAAVLSLAGRSARAEWLTARRTGQLAQARQKLAGETRMRARAEHELAGVEANITYLHEALPVMVAFVDDQHRLKYHNRAFRHGLGVAAGRVDDRPLREVVGNVAYGEWVEDLSTAFGGRAVHRDRTHKSSAGETFRLLMQYLPKFNEGGAVVGVFVLSTDITAPGDVAIAANPLVHSDTPPVVSPGPPTDRVATAMPGQDEDARRLRDALVNDEFCLFFQPMEPLAAKGLAVPFREILLRLKMEEESLMPPGSFLPVAEKYGMLPDLDRWVVRHLLGWMRADSTRQEALYSINISAQTIADDAFPAFVLNALRETGLPGTLFCFELQETDLLSLTAEAAGFVARLRPEGCRFAICGFGGNRASFEMLRNVPVDFLKIDGSLILNIRQSAVDRARVKAIHRVAQAVGIRTVAQCVEDGKTLALLRSIGVDFAQGFGISRPRDLRYVCQELPADKGSDAAGSCGGDAIAAE